MMRGNWGKKLRSTCIIFILLLVFVNSLISTHSLLYSLRYRTCTEPKGLIFVKELEKIYLFLTNYYARV